MWDSLKEQILEVGCVKMTGADASTYIKNNQVVFLYDGNKLPLKTAQESPVTIRHIGGGSVKLNYKLIEVLAKIERPE